MIIQLNGESHETAATDLAELVRELGLPAPTLLIEHNAEATRRAEWPERTLAEGDRVEILRVAAGG